MKRRTRLQQAGFTLIEMLVIAPVVILAIGAFITVIISMTGEVLASRASNTLTYSVQDALNKIEQDVKLSASFLAENSITLTSNNPQGFGETESTTNFTNVGGANGTSLIINTLATNGNPVAASSKVVYLTNKPNPCNSSDVSGNVPMAVNIVYYLRDNSLWRRTIMPLDYAGGSAVSCTNPWQTPSCNPGYTHSFCKTEDIRLVDGVAEGDFTINYYATSDSDTPSTAAVTGASVAARNLALQSTVTVGVNIKAQQNVAGRTVERSASLRATRLETNASTIVTPPSDTTVSAPVVTGSYGVPDKANFSWPIPAGGNVTYDIDYSIDGGANWITGLVNTTNTSYTVTAPYNGMNVQLRVRAKNSVNTTSYTTATVTIPLWVPLLMNGGWSNYSVTYAAPAYTKTKDGIVLTKGLIGRTASAVANEVLATLPAGYRPLNGKLIFGNTTFNGSGPGIGRVDVDTAGNIILVSGSASYFSLDTIRFVASDKYTRVAATFANSWTNYGGTNAPASFVIDDTGRVQMEGLILPGTSTLNTRMITLPENAMPDKYLHIPGMASAWGFFAVGQQGGANLGVLYRSGGTYISVNGMWYPTGSATWSSLPLSGAWVNFGEFYPLAQYTKSSDGIVSVRGLIKSGANTQDTTAAVLPVGHRPKERLILNASSSDAFSRVDVLPSGEIRYYGTSNAWFTLSGINFIAEQ